MTRPGLRVLVLLAVVLVACALLAPRFLEFGFGDGRLRGALVDVAHRGMPTLLLALGMTLVIGLGGIDLSVGSTMAIGGALAALVLAAGGAAWVAFALGLAGGLCVGLGNGLLVRAAGVPPLVATLITLTAGRGLAQALTGGQIVTFERPEYAALASGAFLGLPVTLWQGALATVALGALLRATRLGLYLEACGDNPRAARLCGLPVARMHGFAYALTGVLAAWAGQLAAADIRAADVHSTGLYLELDAILAVVLGGTALTGGRIHLLGSVLGVLILQALTTALLMRGAGTEALLVGKAVAVLVFALLTRRPA